MAKRQENITNDRKIKLLKPKNDFVFQSLFNQNNERITKAFVQALLEEKINSIVINSDKELFREKPEDKLGILDLQLDVNNDEKIDVEIQLIEREDFIQRLLFYLSRLYDIQIKRGKKYSEVKRTVIIAILDYQLDLTRVIEEMETKWNLREEKYKELKLTNLLEIRIIELDKVRKHYQRNKESKKLQWIMFLDNPNSREVQDIMEENEEIKEAVVKVHEMSEDEKMQRIAFLREKAILDKRSVYDTGLHKGIEQGAEKSKKEIAKKLLELDVKIEDIIAATGLSKEEIEKLK